MIQGGSQCHQEDLSGIKEEFMHIPRNGGAKTLGKEISYAVCRRRKSSSCCSFAS